MVSTRNVGNHLTLKVNGGGDLTETLKVKLEKGENTIKLKDLGANVTARDIDLLEGKGLTLVSAEIEGKKSKSATLVVRADEEGKKDLRVNIRLTNGAAQMSHRLLLSNSGAAEWASYAGCQAGGTPVNGATLTIVAGETRSRFSPQSFALRAADGLESAPTAVSEAGPNVYRFDHPKKIDLKSGDQAKSINLFNQDFAVKQVDTILTFQGSGPNTWARDAHKTNAGDVNTRFELENTAANGLGKILPGGEVVVKNEEGIEVAATRIADTSIDKKIVLKGGSAFDVDTTRLQTSFENVGAVRTEGSGNAAQKFQTVRAGQEIELSNSGKTDRLVQFNDAIPQSQDPKVQTKISNVAVDGVAVADGKWSINAENGALQIADVQVKAKASAKVTYTIETANQVG